MDVTERGITLREAVLPEPRIVAELGVAGIERLFDIRQDTGCRAQMVDSVLA